MPRVHYRFSNGRTRPDTDAEVMTARWNVLPTTRFLSAVLEPAHWGQCAPPADRRIRTLFITLTLAFANLCILGATEFSELAPLAAKSLLLDVTKAGDRFVAVGDRGHILI